MQGSHFRTSLSDGDLHQVVGTDITVLQKLGMADTAGQIVGKFPVEKQSSQCLPEAVQIHFLRHNTGKSAVAGVCECRFQVLLIVMFIVKAVDAFLSVLIDTVLTVVGEVIEVGGILLQKFNGVHDLESGAGWIQTL